MKGITDPKPIILPVYYKEKVKQDSIGIEVKRGNKSYICHIDGYRKEFGIAIQKEIRQELKLQQFKRYKILYDSEKNVLIIL